jgi:type I pantothenate kinase
VADGFLAYARAEWVAMARGFPRDELEAVYAPLARVARDAVRDVDAATPVVAVVGSVAVGKSTAARMLAAMLDALPEHPAVSVVGADGFLFPNRVLAARGLLERKGFPETYDESALVQFLDGVRGGGTGLRVPQYSHERYDVLDETQELGHPDMVVVEGLHLLRAGIGEHVDFGIYVDADERDIEQWFTDRMRSLRDEAVTDPSSFFRYFASHSDDELVAFAREVWDTINGVNLHQHILPTRERAHVVLEKQADHSVGRVLLRRDDRGTMGS